MEKSIGEKVNIAVFISGRGSNLKSLIKNYKKNHSLIKIKLVISNDPKAKGLDFAKKSKIKSFIINFKKKKCFRKKIVKKTIN